MGGIQQRDAQIFSAFSPPLCPGPAPCVLYRLQLPLTWSHPLIWYLMT